MSFSNTNSHLDRALALALDNQPLDREALDAVLSAAAFSTGTGAQPEPYARLLEGARELRRAHSGSELSLCAIVNAKSGGCSEDCAFCAQSSRHKTLSPRHPFLDPEEIARAAEAMLARGATRFGIVASGLCPTGGDFERLLRAVELVAATGMHADVSVGLLTAEQLDRLVAAGLSGVHHNLEVAESFFPQICTTHAYEEDVFAVRQALQAGLFVCSGGIFGLGESWAQRAELALTLRELGVKNVPVNFLIPIAGTRMEHRPVLSRAESLAIVAVLRYLLPRASLRVCGGRGLVFGAANAETGQGQSDLFDSGVNGLMIGDYLTTPGTSIQADLDLADELGFSIAPAVSPAEPEAGG